MPGGLLRRLSSVKSTCLPLNNGAAAGAVMVPYGPRDSDNRTRALALDTPFGCLVADKLSPSRILAAAVPGAIFQETRWPLWVEPPHSTLTRRRSASAPDRPKAVFPLPAHSGHKAIRHGMVRRVESRPAPPLAAYRRSRGQFRAALRSPSRQALRTESAAAGLDRLRACGLEPTSSSLGRIGGAHWQKLLAFLLASALMVQ
jgi:hypothetical protein